MKFFYFFSSCSLAMCEACHSMFALCSALVPKSEAKGLPSRDGNSSEVWACSDQAKKETMANMLMFIIHCSMTENPRKSTPKTQKNEKSYLFFRLNSLTIKGMPKIAPRFLCHFCKWLNRNNLPICVHAEQVNKHDPKHSNPRQEK